MQSNFITFRNATLENCKKICNNLDQCEDLHMEKFKRIVKDIDEKITAYTSPEEFGRLMYNESIRRLKQTAKF